MDNSESVTADAYGQRHLSIPLRDDEGRAIVAIDISIGELKNLPKLESREVMRILRLLQMAYREISIESRGGEPSTLLGIFLFSCIFVLIIFLQQNLTGTCLCLVEFCQVLQ